MGQFQKTKVPTGKGSRLDGVTSGNTTPPMDQEVPIKSKDLAKRVTQGKGNQAEAKAKTVDPEQMVKLASVPKSATAAKPGSLHEPVKDALPLPSPSKDSRYKLAVFPWLLRGEATFFTSQVLDSIKVAIEKKKSFIPVFSYYDLRAEHQTKSLKGSFLSRNVIDDLWIRKGFFSKLKPNIDLICKLGEELKVDVVLIYYLSARTMSEDKTEISPIEVFLIDVNRKGHYVSRRASVYTNSVLFIQNLEKLVENAFSDFLSADAT